MWWLKLNDLIHFQVFYNLWGPVQLSSPLRFVKITKHGHFSSYWNLTALQFLVGFSFRPEYGHYTHVAWAETLRVGCGYREIGETGRYIFACNYAPGGNFQGRPVYVDGPACSTCPADLSQCDDGLCTAAGEPRIADQNFEIRKQPSASADSVLLIKLSPCYGKTKGMC